MDKTILNKKRKNLIASNKNSNELVLHNNFVDLLCFFNQSELLDFFNNGAINELRINKVDVINRIKTTIKNTKDIYEFNNSLDIFGLQEYKINEEKDFSSKKEKMLNGLANLIVERIDLLLNYSIQSRLDYYDTSIWTMYLSFGLLQGNVKFLSHEDLLVNAPLINIEIEINKNEQGEIVLHKINEKIQANEILEMSLDEQLEKKTLIGDKIVFDSFNSNEYFQYFKEIITDINVVDAIEQTQKIKNEQLVTTLPIIKKCFLISLINPIGGKMLRDYDEILNRDYSFPVYDTIFHKDLNHLIYENDDVFEINNPMNLSQKLAVANSLNKNVLVYGPPGTGKSEVVANLITNILISNKNVVVISEKKAALDVIDERLQSLSVLSMSAVDDKNSNDFYNKIINLNRLIIATNKIDLKNDSVAYYKMLDYQKLVSELSIYKDINKKTLFDFLTKYNTIDLNIYQNNLEIIKFIFNKLITDNISLKNFVEKLNTFRNIQTYYDSIFGVDKVNQCAFNHQSIQQLINVLNEANEKDKAYIIEKFLCENELVNKRSLLKIKSKIEKTLNLEKIQEIFNLIITSKLTFILNNRKLFNFFNTLKDLSEWLISWYDWSTNTKIKSLIELISNDITTQKLIKEYWNYHKLNSSKFDKLVTDYCINYLKDRILSNHDIEIKWTELVRIANLNKKPNVNKIVKEYYETLKFIFPIWILSPDIASIVIPLKQNEFNYGIFDEASQMRIERGLPLIYRCQFLIVSGDDKQLKPSSFFSKTTSLDETYQGDLDNVDSLLDKAKSSNWMSFTLNNHYRAISEQLIWYSSHYFYNDNLICISKNGEFKKVVDVFDENGIYNREKGINEQEANKVIQCLLTSIDQFKTAIVITFNTKQADFIQRLAFSHTQLRQKLETLDIKIRSLENVQGDEAELIVISCTFGKDASGKFLQNFGPVNQDGGRNRINVMASRAKYKMVVIKSFNSSDITNDKNENTYAFKAFIAYCEQVVNNQQGNTNSTHTKKIYSEETNSIITDLITELKATNTDLLFEKNKKIGTHTIDLAVSKQNDSKVILSILVDDKTKNGFYHTNIKQWIVDVDKQKYYEDRGYQTYRINLVEWLLNKRFILKNIRESII